MDITERAAQILERATFCYSAPDDLQVVLPDGALDDPVLMIWLRSNFPKATFVAAGQMSPDD